MPFPTRRLVENSVDKPVDIVEKGVEKSPARWVIQDMHLSPIGG